MDTAGLAGCRMELPTPQNAGFTMQDCQQCAEGAGHFGDYNQGEGQHLVFRGVF